MYDSEPKILHSKAIGVFQFSNDWVLTLHTLNKNITLKKKLTICIMKTLRMACNFFCTKINWFSNSVFPTNLHLVWLSSLLRDRRGVCQSVYGTSFFLLQNKDIKQAFLLLLLRVISFPWNGSSYHMTERAASWG